VNSTVWQSSQVLRLSLLIRDISWRFAGAKIRVSAVIVCRAQRREKKQRDKAEKERQKQVSAKPDMSAGLTAEEIAMMQNLGLPFGFNTTQGLQIDDEAANESALKISSQRKPRQYMNRKGGFNRPLPAEQTGKKMQQV
jgi:hypothetical protein